MVARDGVEPPTPAFSDILNQQLNSSGRSIYCDQSVTNYYDQLVTSADVRLASALKLNIDSATHLGNLVFEIAPNPRLVPVCSLLGRNRSLKGKPITVISQKKT